MVSAGAREFHLDDINYVIVPTKGGNDFAARWTCQCGCGGTYAGTFDNESAAIEQAKRDLRYHHDAKHKG